jgi:hypothetical protein
MPTTNPAEAAAVRDAITRYNAASSAGDTAGALKSIRPSSEMQRNAFVSMGTFFEATPRLFKATETKFGADQLAAAQISAEIFPSPFPQLPLENLEIKVSGERASIVDAEGVTLPFNLVKTDGTWQFDGDTFMPPQNEKQLKDQNTLIAVATAVFDKLTAATTAGNFESPEEVVMLMQIRMKKAMQEAQMKMMAAEMKDAATQPATAPAGPQMPPSDAPVAPQPR